MLVTAFTPAPPQRRTLPTCCRCSRRNFVCKFHESPPVYIVHGIIYGPCVFTSVNFYTERNWRGTINYRVNAYRERNSGERRTRERKNGEKKRERETAITICIGRNEVPREKKHAKTSGLSSRQSIFANVPRTGNVRLRLSRARPYRTSSPLCR